MAAHVRDILEAEPVRASAPCRVDMGGTLDISTFYYPLAHLSPCTVNLALSLRTTVQLLPHRKGWIRVSSRGFESLEYELESLPFDHPLGLIFAIAAHFHLGGIHIQIDSASPPESALGGSSVAAVALVGAYQKLLENLGGNRVSLRETALLAYGIESVTAGVACGLQDQLASTYGGVHAWYWKGPGYAEWYQKEVLAGPAAFSVLDKSVLLAYCGIPHASKDINGRWVRQFLSGRFRQEWSEVAECSRSFRSALQSLDFDGMARWMNREVDLRCQMTPDVLDDTGRRLVIAARELGCGARFCGAGGGGCIWAIGASDAIADLRGTWDQMLSRVPGGVLLDAAVDPEGLKVSG